MQSMHGSTLPDNVYEEGDGRAPTSALATVIWTLAQALDEEVPLSLRWPRDDRHIRPRRPAATRSGVYARPLWTQ